jgi:hypothetical protein
MTYYPDLSPYEYSGGNVEENVVNIGWLDIAHDYPKGEVSERFIEKLWAFCRVAVDRARGLHFCDFCGVVPYIPPKPGTGIQSLMNNQEHWIVVQRGEDILILGSCEIRVFGRDGVIYAAPNLVYHYIVEHQYRPPDVFIQAVLEGPQPGSDEYQALLSQHDRPVGTPPSLSFVPIKLRPADVVKPPPKPLSAGKPIVDRDGFVSGGLGLSRETWERTHTQSGVDSFLGDVTYAYDDDRYWVRFKNDYVQLLSWRQYDSPITIDEARDKGITLIPQDSQFVKAYVFEYMTDAILNLYLSESLKDRFGSDAWPGGEPGNFLVRYLLHYGRVISITVDTGNEPL